MTTEFNSISPDPVDAYVGSRIVIRRKQLKISRKALAKKIGLTPPQVQKYEAGTNRVSAGVLFEIAEALDVPVGFFHDLMPEDVANRKSNIKPSLEAVQLAKVTARYMVDDDAKAVVRYVGADGSRRRRVMQLLASMNGESRSPKL